MGIRMADQAVYCFLFLLTLFEMFTKTKMSAQGNGHAFMQANNEVRYLAENIPVSMHKDLSGVPVVRVPGLDENSIYSSKSQLKFDPPLLDFKQRHLGMPHHEKVTLFNVNNNKTIHMSSISGNTVHFHSSFFEDKVIPPLGNTTFNVVFLGREEGEIESNLFIHTSEGSFKYQVKGASVGSPYRLRPLVGVKIPVNASYSPLIYIHNPHSSPMQIIEVYSSGGEFHLELPSGELEGPKHLWEIPPFHTKPVIRVRFTARSEKNHTAYIRIKVNKSEEVLVVPLEVEVGSSAGLYSPDDVIDFGIGGSKDKPKQISLSLINSWKKMIRIHNVVTTPPTRAVKINFQPTKVPPNSKLPTHIAVLTFDWKEAFRSNHYSGKIVIKNKQGQQKLVIPYIAQIFEGGLEYNASVPKYYSDAGDRNSMRNFTVTNMFKIPLALVNVTLSKEAWAYFVVQNFTPVILSPGKTIVLFQLAFRKQLLPPDLKLESNLFIHTNISTVSVPLLFYNGKLMKIIISGLNETEINFGTVGSTSQREAHFALLNNNPVPVNLESWGTNLTGALVELIGIEEGNRSSILQKHSFKNMSRSLILQPGHYAVFRVFVIAPGKEEVLNAEVFVKTKFERVVVPAKMRVAHGRLEIIPEPLVLDDCFPGKLCVQQLHVRSLFSRAMAVTSVISVPPDPRVSFSLDPGASHIVELVTSSFGKLQFDLDLGCGSHCYTGIPHNTSEGSQWLHTLSLPLHCQDSDLTLLTFRYNLYLSLAGFSSAWRNITLRLDTTEVRGHMFNARVHMVWPKVTSVAQSRKQNMLDFPLTQVGDTVYQDITLYNPSSKPLVVQLVMDWAYPQSSRMLDSLPLRVLPRCVECSLHQLGEFLFEDHSLNSAQIEKQLGVKIHKDSVPFYLKPGERIITKLAFSPSKSGLNSAVLFIRNNLTILEVLRISGRATQAQFKFGNRKPGSDEPLLFELSKKHLKDCETFDSNLINPEEETLEHFEVSILNGSKGEKLRKFPAPNLTVKRSFTARNTGELPIYISGFRINGLPCEGYGFRIMNCAAFHLEPNGTRKIDIAFTPDFTLARIQRTLGIDTSLGVPVNYTLITTLPPYFLATCSSVLSRPNWEPLLYYSAVSFMTFLFFCVLAAAFLESDRILKCTLVALAKDKVSKGSLDIKLPTSCVSTGMSSSQKYSADRSVLSKMENVNDWNTSNSSTIHHHEKRNRETHNVPNAHGGASNPKSCSWSSIEEKIAAAEADTKDRPNCNTKYDEPDAGYSTSSTPLLSIKCKKKLSKKNSNNSDASSETFHDGSIISKKWNGVFTRSGNTPNHHQSGKSRLNLAEPKISTNKHNRELEIVPPTKKSLEISKENKKLNRVFKKNNKVQPEPIVCSEEETSSTTTESSNNDEVEKERESSAIIDRPNKVSPKKEKSSSLDYRDNYEGDCDDDDYERDGLKKKDFSLRWKSNYRVLGKTIPELPVKSNGADSTKSSNLELPYKLKTSKNSNRERKDKNALKRRLAEKNISLKPIGSASNASASVIGVSSSSGAGTSPPLRSSSCWGEHRASFSDVVARNDSPLYSNIVAPRKRNVQAAAVNSPPSFVETNPRKLTEMGSGNISVPPSSSGTTGLGPIGPKKSSVPVWENFAEHQQQPTHFLQHQESQNLFMDSLAEPSIQNEDSMSHASYPDNLWDQRSSVMTLLDDEAHKGQEDYQRPNVFRESWPTMDALWKPLYTPPTIAESSSMFPGEHNNQTPLWGSLGSVWSSSTWSPGPGPVAPPITTAVPTISPPQPQIETQEEDGGSPTLTSDFGYNPFSSLNTIWLPRSSDAWNGSGNN